MPDVAVEEFDTSRLGAWVPSREQKIVTGLECTGLLRPAFEVQLDGTNQCLFLKKNLILKPGQLVVL